MPQMDAKTQADLADMMLALAHNPKTRPAIAKAARDAGLPVTFNDVQQSESAVAAAREAAKGVITEDRAEQERSALQARLTRDRAELVSSGRFTDDSVKQLDAFMQANGIGDYKNGAILYAHENPAAQHHSEIANARLWEMPKGDWIKDPHGTARKAAHQAIGEIMAARR
jgi:hypothetical protein